MGARVLEGFLTLEKALRAKGTLGQGSERGRPASAVEEGRVQLALP